MIDSQNHTVIILGAGPSGLATAASLKGHGIDSLILEQSDQLGGTYASHSPAIRLVSPPTLSALPNFKLPYSEPRISFSDYLSYLRNYTQHFKLNVQTKNKVTSVQPLDRGYSIHTESGKQFSCTHLVIATGYSSYPNTLPLEFQTNSENVDILHSSQFQRVKEISNHKILIVGSGTSATEIASFLYPRNQVVLAVYPQHRRMPNFLLGLNFHYFIRWIEKLPVRWHKQPCHGNFVEPAFDFDLNEAIKQNRIKIRSSPFLWDGQKAQWGDEHFSPNTIIVANGYQFDVNFLKWELPRRKNGSLKLIRNQLPSTANLYFVGFPCALGVDSKFIRGIHRDSQYVAELIRARLG